MASSVLTGILKGVSGGAGEYNRILRNQEEFDMEQLRGEAQLHRQKNLAKYQSDIQEDVWMRQQGALEKTQIAKEDRDLENWEHKQDVLQTKKEENLEFELDNIEAKVRKEFGIKQDLADQELAKVLSDDEIKMYKRAKLMREVTPKSKSVSWTSEDRKTLKDTFEAGLLLPDGISFKDTKKGRKYYTHNAEGEKTGQISEGDVFKMLEDQEYNKKAQRSSVASPSYPFFGSEDKPGISTAQEAPSAIGEAAKVEEAVIPTLDWKTWKSMSSDAKDQLAQEIANKEAEALETFYRSPKNVQDYIRKYINETLGSKETRTQMREGVRATEML